jgi:hypothetical protein
VDHDTGDQATHQGNGLAVACLASAQCGMDLGNLPPIALRCLGEELDHIRIGLVLEGLCNPFALGDELVDAWPSCDRIDVAVLDQRQQPRDLPLYFGGGRFQLGARPAPRLGQVLALALVHLDCARHDIGCEQVVAQCQQNALLDFAHQQCTSCLAGATVGTG